MGEEALLGNKSDIEILITHSLKATLQCGFTVEIMERDCKDFERLLHNNYTVPYCHLIYGES